MIKEFSKKTYHVVVKMEEIQTCLLELKLLWTKPKYISQYIIRTDFKGKEEFIRCLYFNSFVFLVLFVSFSLGNVSQAQWADVI